MNMSNKNWKQKSLTPVLLKETDDSFSTVVDLQNAIKEDDILNIAVTGPYGSGKSSVLRTFQSKVDSEVKILDISLATLDADESLKHEEKEQVNPKNVEESKLLQEQKELLNRKIEYSILQQLVYRKTLEALPYSRMKKIRHFGEHTIRTIAWYVIGFVICISLASKLSILQIPLLYKSLNIPNSIQDAISIISVIFLIIMSFDILRYVIKNFAGLRPQKISVGGSQIDVHDDGSIFNRYLEEILYFFQCTDYNVVIIEDLDRFNTTEIFLKLRELNHLINKSEMVNRTIKFIYAVKDDMFKDSSRSKFFDYITTVIPVITTTNSKDKLKEALEELGHKDEVPDEDIRDIAFHIDDMRLLYNIANEYHQYSLRLSKEEHPLNASKMLAMMTVKNYHPHDFSELHNRKGKLYQALSKEAKREYIEFAIESRLSKREELANKDLDVYNASCHLSIKELRLVYLLALKNKVGLTFDIFIIDGRNYSISQIAEKNELFDSVRNGSVIAYRYYDSNYGRQREGSLNYSFSEIEKEVNPSYTYAQRAAKIGVDKSKLEAELIEVEREKNRISSYKIHQLIERFNIYDEKFFKEIGLSPLEEDLIRRGYISEDYNDYISYFYPGIMSMADHLLCLDMKLNRKTEYDSPIDNVELFVQELPPPALHYISTWNYYLLDYLSEHNVIEKGRYNLALDTLMEKDSAHFLYCYNNNSTRARSVFVDCMKRDSKKMWDKITTAGETEREELYKFWFSTCSISDIRGLQLKWINSNYVFMESIFEYLLDDIQELLTTKMNYDSISLSESDMLKRVVSNGCYILNEKNMPVVVAVKAAKNDIAKLNNIEEMQLALKLDLITATWYNVNEYYKSNEDKVDEYLIQYVDRHIEILLDEKTDQDEEYSELFQSLLEEKLFNDSTYADICEASKYCVEFNDKIQGLSHAKLEILIVSKTIEYSQATFIKLCKLSSILGCTYIVTYRDKIDEMLQAGVMNTPLAECLLKDGKLNQYEHQKVIASLKSSDISMSQALANRICEIITLQYCACEAAVLYDAISMCTNESHAVMTAVRQMNASGMDYTTINDLLGILPSKYHDLMELYKKPKFDDNNYNKVLIDALKGAGYISSYKVENGKIRVETKHK